MIGMVIVAVIIALLAGFIGTLIALKLQYRYLQSVQAQRTAWEYAQESGQRNWEIKQGKRSIEMDAKLNTRVQQVENEWNTWKQKNAELVQTVTQQHAEIATFLRIERELARIPLVEEMPIAFDGKGQRLPTSSRWHPLSLARVDLSDRDLSRRYLGQANLRDARLRGANFFMADLSGADLTGADLTGADLTGANLAHADLRNAILLNANLQVADLHNAILFGANLHGARNLSRQQLDTAIYDGSSQVDADFDLTMPRLPALNKSMLASASSMTNASTRPVQPAFSDRPTIAKTPVVKAKKQETDTEADAVANVLEAEIPDLDIPPTPGPDKNIPSSPALSTTDEIIEGEVTEISDAVILEVEAITGTSPSEPTDAEIREISEGEIHESEQSSESVDLAAPDEEPAASESELFFAESDPPISVDEPTVAESAPPLSASEPTVAESDTTHETPSPVAGSVETEAPIALETSPVEPAFVPLASEQDGDRNGHNNGSGNRNGQKRGTSPQKGKNTNRKRSRTR